MIRKTVSIICFCGENLVTGEEFTKEARAEARKKGWWHSKFSGDRCPRCVKLDEEEHTGLISPSPTAFNSPIGDNQGH